MRLLFVVQRYGADVAGGAEQHCRQFTTRMAGRGHDVDVLTSCAIRYTDWADYYAPGTESLEGVIVHRLPVRRPRDPHLAGPLDERVVLGRKPAPFYLQREWVRLQGPDLPDLERWLEVHAANYDVVVFFTYLYETTVAGLPVAARTTPTILHPTAHDEPPFGLQLFELALRHANAFACSTEEEARLIRSKLHGRPPISEIGIGVEMDVDGDGAAFRVKHGLGRRPYILYVGRVDPHKGSEELHEFFVTYKRRQPGDLALVIMGEQIRPLPAHPDIIATGYVDDATREGAIAGAVAMVVPSYFESFSMVLTEAWAARKAALVQGWCDVLAGQARRSGGAIPYRGFAEFEVALDAIVSDQTLARALGEAGRRYVEERYRWDDVLDRYERQLRLVMDGRLAG
ncbi:MAG TPA: glycosyltransferase family 4 protein [Acidimicrobiales bacterium]|jgi:glycosyltransferase involved in cell wall biosynthesis